MTIFAATRAAIVTARVTGSVFAGPSRHPAQVAGHHGGLFPLVLLVLAAAALYALWVWCSPIGRCRRCHGLRLVRTALLGRQITCPTCQGTGLARRPGATTVHRLYQQGRAHQARAARTRTTDQNHTPDAHDLDDILGRRPRGRR